MDTTQAEGTVPPQEDLGIDSLSSSGEGVGRLEDGRVVFVPFTAPGDRVRVSLEEDHGRWLRGRLVSLETPGPDRCEPRCPVFGECGGCALQHIGYAAQLEAKRRMLAEALARIGRVALPDSLVVHASPQPYGYRGRTRVLVQGEEVGYRRQGSHELCAVTSCPVLTPDADAALAALADRCQAAVADAAPPAAGDWEIVAGAETQTRVWPLGAARADRAGKANGANARAAEAEIFIAVGAERLRVSPGVFTQANVLLVEALCAAVAAAAAKGESGRDHCLELFAGAGFLTLPLARVFDRVLAVEFHPRAVADLVFNLDAAGLSHVEVRRARAEIALHEIEVPSGGVVVVDPPRQGLAAEVTESLARLAPRRIVYLSCDPATLARDLRRFADRGFAMTQIEAFDFFPQTPHLEALAVLEPS